MFNLIKRKNKEIQNKVNTQMEEVKESLKVELKESCRFDYKVKTVEELRAQLRMEA